MKTHMNRHGMILLTLLIGAMTVSIGSAAEEGSGTYFVWSDMASVKPELMETYMKTRIADAKLCAENKFEFPFLTFVDGFNVHMAGLFRTFSQLDGFPQKMAAWNTKTGGKAEQLEQQSSQCVSHHNSWISVYRPDLSYEPENPAFTPDFSKPFHQIAVIYSIKPGKYETAQEVGKKIKAAHERGKSPLGYRVYEHICGEGVPAFAVVMTTKDKAQFVMLDAKMKANPNDEVRQIMTENADVLTGVETKEAEYVPEASYVPEGTL